ncbi:energy-coupling factor ABC transporter ATP-binding protein [Ferrimonas balearica]|uniref:energy-coupling factor ABC transporter ATP-binding protein n=1 Tax=Ferrimonas balearica TaxID=44012 RepID=UPI001F44209F|nr:energy-coupling factor ABC transporter ATP-binding protein [Ferrimonas balearica]MBY6019258.1 energy-coupling factor ABC transporter ATP-binding protein [Halomonas denitrificans]MBY6095861.1 energy-coupling factor ABC transporter ATP-binding protein [Ferrimonas balearica]
MQLTATALEMRFDQRLLFRIPELVLTGHQRIWLKGPNGVGKTTLMKVLAGLARPTRGKVRLDGAPSRRWRRDGSPLGQVVYLHQSPYLFDGSVWDNLAYGLNHLALSVNERDERIREALCLARLDHLAERPAQVLSGGERQRLALARAWVLNPRFLLLDEPSANLDPDSLRLITEMVDQLYHQGCGLIITSHQQTELTDRCEEHWILENQGLVCLREADQEEARA